MAGDATASQPYGRLPAIGEGRTNPFPPHVKIERRRDPATHENVNETLTALDIHKTVKTLKDWANHTSVAVQHLWT